MRLVCWGMQQAAGKRTRVHLQDCPSERSSGRLQSLRQLSCRATSKELGGAEQVVGMAPVRQGHSASVLSINLLHHAITGNHVCKQRVEGDVVRLEDRISRSSVLPGKCGLRLEVWLLHGRRHGDVFFVCGGLGTQVERAAHTRGSRRPRRKDVVNKLRGLGVALGVKAAQIPCRVRALAQNNRRTLLRAGRADGVFPLRHTHAVELEPR